MAFRFTWKTAAMTAFVLANLHTAVFADEMDIMDTESVAAMVTEPPRVSGPPVLTLSTNNGGRLFATVSGGKPGVAYTIETSVDGRVWTPLGGVSLPADAVDGGSVIDATLERGVTRYYRLVPPSGDEYGASGQVAFAFDAPPVPAGVCVVSREPYTLSVTWPDASLSEAGWTLRRRMKGKKEWREVADVAQSVPAIGDAMEYTDKGLLPGVRYEYELTAYGLDAQGNRVPSSASAFVEGMPKGLDSVAPLVTGIDGVPERYASLVGEIAAAHPKWTFGFLHTGLRFSDVLETEYLQAANPKTDLAAFREMDPAVLDDRTRFGVLRDGNFSVTKKEGLAFFLEPGNFLNDGVGGIYQFMRLGLDGRVTEADIVPLLKGTVFAADAASYATWFMEAGMETGVSPLALLAKSIVEGGAASAKPSPLLTGYAYQGITVYNFYGVGAYDGNALQNGAKYAFDKGWFTPRAAISGGAQKIQTYVAKGQDTYYHMRYNIPGLIKGTGLYPQYATNIGDAAVKGRMMARAAGILGDAPLGFLIPVFE